MIQRRLILINGIYLNFTFKGRFLSVIIVLAGLFQDLLKNSGKKYDNKGGGD